MTLPSIPSLYTDLVDTRYSRGQPIRNDYLDDIQYALNHICAKRVNCLFNKSYMTRAAGADVTAISSFDATSQVVICSLFAVRPRDKVIWLRFRTLADDCEIQLRLDTASSLTSAKTFTHVHANTGTPTLAVSYIGVNPNTWWYGDIQLDGSGNADPWAISLWEWELDETHISNTVPAYATIAAAEADLGPSGTDRPLIRIGDYLMTRYPGSLIYSGAGDIWVPYDYRDALLIEAYQGGIAGGVGVNANWADTTGGGGSITLTPASDRSDFNTTANPGDTAYTTATPSANFDPTLIYLKAKAVSGTYAPAGRLVVDNGVKRAYITITNGTVGDVNFYTLTTPADYANGTALTEFLIEVNSEKDNVSIWLYQTMELICSASYAEVAATVALILEWGDSQVGGTGVQTYLEGDPAIVVLQGRFD